MSPYPPQQAQQPEGYPQQQHAPQQAYKYPGQPQYGHQQVCLSLRPLLFLWLCYMFGIT